MSKYGLIKQKQADHAKNEKEILQSISHPFIVNMNGFDQDTRCIYIIQDFIRGGEFLTLLKQKRTLDIDCARFFATQMVLMLKYLHNNNILYRDLKPENMLVDKSGYLKFIDFGLSKKVYSKTYTICGTPHYIAPEVLTGGGYGEAADLYSLGVVLYEILVGVMPFDADNHKDLFQKIIKDKPKFPKNIDRSAYRLIKSLLNKNPTERKSIPEIMKSSFFKGTDFDGILMKDLEPPFFPSVKSDNDTSNFKQIKAPMLSKENCPKLLPKDDIFLDW